MAGETPITVVGNLTADPELRYTQSGLAVVNFNIASTPSVFDKTQNKFVDGDPLFLRGTAWKEFAEHIAGSFHKGSRVIVQGNLKQKSYTDKDQNKRTSFEVDVQAIGGDVRFGTTSFTSGSTSAPKSSEPEPDVWSTPSTYSDETPF